MPKPQQEVLAVYPRFVKVTVNYSDFMQEIVTRQKLGEITVFSLTVKNDRGCYEVEMREHRAPVRGTRPPPPEIKLPAAPKEEMLL